MPLSPDFHFCDIPAIQAEVERRALVMFGENWESLCKSISDKIIVADANKSLTFSETFKTICCGEGDCRQDLTDGSPSVIEFHPDGAVKRLTHHRDGKAHDPIGFLPAIIEYHQDGTIASTLHCLSGQLVNPDDGSPSGVQYSEAGEISSGYLVGNGKISAEQVLSLNNAAQVNRVAALLAKADQAVVPSGLPLDSDGDTLLR